MTDSDLILELHRDNLGKLTALETKVGNLETKVYAIDRKFWVLIAIVLIDVGVRVAPMIGTAVGLVLP